MLSMTAFASVSGAKELLSWRWELRSVNHRYLDVQCRLPEALKGYESVCREVVRQRLHRGKVEVSLKIEHETLDRKPRLNTEKLFQLARLLEEVHAILPHTAPVDPLAVLALPQMLCEQDNDDPDALDESFVVATLNAALDQLVAEKNREGSALRAVLQQKAESALGQVKQLNDQLETIMVSHIAQLKQRVRLIAPDLDETRWVQEVALLAQKADISEEMDRLQVHLHDLLSLLRSGEPVGRKLDFLMQELNREANTLGAKSVVLAVTQASLALKVLIEQMREQIQNVE